MKENERGKFVALEGIGGAGKSTQTELVAKYLESRGTKFILTREPGGSTEAETVRKLVFELKASGAVNPDQQVALFSVARYFWIKNQVSPAIEAGIHVITDRTSPSTAAYQGYAEGASIDNIRKITSIVVGDYKLDAVILLDSHPEVAMARRRAAKSGKEDPYDKEQSEYFENVFWGYRRLAIEKFGDCPWYIIDADLSRKKVFKQIKIILDKILRL